MKGNPAAAQPLARPRSSPPGNNTAIVETLSVPNADCFFTINQLGLQEVLTEQGFQEFKTRDVVCYVREIACRA